MKKALIIVLLLFGMAVQRASAQIAIVRGVVTSEDDNEPLIGATVRVPNSNIGTITDINGEFILKDVPEMYKELEISYTGMKEIKMNIPHDGKFITVSLSENSKYLDEVVVTAIGIMRSERAIGYSATTVKGDELSERKTNDVMSALSGKIAGVQISSSSEPGASNSVIIRGFSSLNGNNQPLYVVDGVPLNNDSEYSRSLDSSYDFGNGANAINPEDVESLTVLKGAAATALYGNRASNGVIMITTKKGEVHKKGLGVEYNGGVQWTTLLRLPQMQNEFGIGWNGNKAETENGSWGPRFDGSIVPWGNFYENTQKTQTYAAYKNNVKDFFDTGVRFNNSVSFNGATDKGTYFVSFSQISDDGIYPTNADSYNKYTFSARGSHKEKNLTFSTSINYCFQENKYITTGQTMGIYSNLLFTPRNIDIVGMKDLNDPYNTPGYYFTPYATNSYYVMENFDRSRESDRLYGKIQMDYDFLNDFKLTYRLGMDKTSNEGHLGIPNMNALFYKGTPNGEELGSGSMLFKTTGKVSQTNLRRHEFNQDLFLTYDKKLTPDYQLNAVVGLNINEHQEDYMISTVTDLTIPTWFNLSNSAKAPLVSSYAEKRRLIGVYSSIEGSYKNLLYLTVNLRNDWSSTLPPNNRNFFYPGIAGSFVFSELLPDSYKKVISFGKLRLAWGKTGNDANVYMVNQTYSDAYAYGYYSKFAFPFIGHNYNAFSTGETLGSSNLSPEMTSESEIGLQMALFNKRISLDASFYNRITDKQILSLDVDPASGFQSQNTNIGKIRNRGIELLVSVTPIQKHGWKWDISCNFTKNWSKVLSMPEKIGNKTCIEGIMGLSSLYAEVGQPLGVFYAPVPQKTESGQIVCNAQNGLPVDDPKGVQIVGDINNKYTMGLSTSISYKDISFGADFDIRQGGIMSSRTKQYVNFTGNGIQTLYNSRNPFIVPNSVNEVVADDGTISYVENCTPIDYNQMCMYWDASCSKEDNTFSINKSYVKLRSVTLGWKLPKKWLAHTFLTDVKVSAYGRNLLLWTPSSNSFIDPEVSTMGNDLQGTYGEYLANPSTRSFGLNVNVKF